MSEDLSLAEQLRVRIRELEDKVETLRLSRRVLMNLIENVEREKRDQLIHLKLENEKLQRNNTRYAKTIMACKTRISKLEKEINKLVNSP